MRDERRSTAANDAEPDADKLRVALGRRIRAARTSAGLSQQAVADAMAARQFSWRQTTVAKSEGADRPILFTEIVALSSILKRDLDYFLSGRNALDEAAESIREKLEDARTQVDANLMMLERSRHRLKLAEAREVLISALLDYARTLNGGELREALKAMAAKGQLGLSDVVGVLMTAGIPKDALEALDQRALREAARSDEGIHAIKSTLSSHYHTEEEARALAENYQTSLEAPSYVADIVRETRVYQEVVANRLLHEVIEYVDARPEFEL